MAGLDKEIINNIEAVAKKHGWTEEEIIDVKKACGITEEKQTLSDKMHTIECTQNGFSLDGEKQVGLHSFIKWIDSTNVRETIKEYRKKMTSAGILVGTDVAKEEAIADEEFGKELC